jgi:hypothetical protein
MGCARGRKCSGIYLEDITLWLFNIAMENGP